MTISTTDSRVEYTGNGTTTAFAVPFYFLANGDLYVYQGGTLKTITTHYTVSGAGNLAGGTVTFVSAPNSGQDIVIVRDPAITQETDYVSNDNFPAESHEQALDRLTMIAQRLSDRIDRAPALTDDFVGTVDLTMPDPVAGQTIMWNADADGLTNGPTANEISNAQTYATQAAASATEAAGYLDEFTDLYLGSKAADPTLDNDGAALQTGAFYFNTVSGILRVYNGSTWQDAVTADSVSFTSQTFSGDGAEVAFTLSAAPSGVEFTEVYVSGVRQVPTIDYTLSGTTLTFGVAPALGTNNIFVRWVSAISSYTPADSSVSTAKIQNGAVTYAKIQDVSATSRALGRKTAGAGDVEELTLSELLDFIGSASQGDILYRGAATWARLGAGTSGQYLKTQGAGADPVWATISARGAYELVSTANVTAVASIDFDLQEDIYCEWKFVIDGVIPATDDSILVMRPGYASGTTFVTADCSLEGFPSGGNKLPNWGVIGAEDSAGLAAKGVGTAAGESASAVIEIGGIGSATSGGFVYTSKCSFVDVANSAKSAIIRGVYTGSNERLFDAVRFLWSSGNFEAAGTIKMYALKRAG